MTTKWEKDEALTKLMRERKVISRVQSREKNAHYANGVVGCTRKAVYQFIGAPEEKPDMTSRFVFRMGDKYQEIVEEELNGCKILEAKEENLMIKDSRLKFPFSMRCDFLIQLPKDIDSEQKLRPFEVKSLGPNSYFDKEYPGWGGGPPKIYAGAWSVPKDDYLNQITLYLKSLNMDYGILFCGDRDTGDTTVYRVYYDEERYENIVEACYTNEMWLETYKSTGELPVRHIEPLPLGIYTRGSNENPKGSVKLDKSSYPCVWKNKQTGRFGTCSFFNHCHKDTLEKLGIKNLNEIQDKPEPVVDEDD